MLSEVAISLLLLIFGVTCPRMMFQTCWNGLSTFLPRLVALCWLLGRVVMFLLLQVFVGVCSRNFRQTGHYCVKISGAVTYAPRTLQGCLDSHHKATVPCNGIGNFEQHPWVLQTLTVLGTISQASLTPIAWRSQDLWLSMTCIRANFALNWRFSILSVLEQSCDLIYYSLFRLNASRSIWVHIAIFQNYSLIGSVGVIRMRHAW